MDSIPQNKPEERNCVLLDDQVDTLISIVLSHFNVEEILSRIRSELKTSYVTRSAQYSHFDTIIKLPLERMNEEERFLSAFISYPNMRNDLPSLLSYINALYAKLNAPSDPEIIDDILNVSIANYYASKLKLYSGDAEDSSDDETNNKSNENNEPISEEEARRELEELQSYPLFMTEMPSRPEENEHLQALQALKYEGDAANVAMEFYERAKKCFNDYNKMKTFKDLKEAMYTICNAIDHVGDDVNCDYVKFDLFYLRAQMQEKVKNWGYAVDDANSAIKYIHSRKTEDTKDIDECYFLLINAYMQLENYTKAKHVIDDRLNEIKDKAIRKRYDEYQNEIAKRKQKLLDDLSKMETFKNMKSEKQIAIYDALTNRGIKLRKQIHNIPPGVESEIYIDDESKVHFPLLIIYDEFNMTDYIQDFAENRFIEDIIDIIYENGKLPWDTENHYAKSNTLCYYQFTNYNEVTKDESVLYYPMRNDETLIDVLTNKKLHMNGFPVISVVSTMSANFYSHFLKNKIILKRRNQKNKYSH